MRFEFELERPEPGASEPGARPPGEEAAQRAGRAKRSLERWVADGLLTPYKKRGDRRTHIDLAELPEAMRRAGRPGPKPRGRRDAIR